MMRVDQNKDYISRQYDCSGESEITTYEVFDGVQLVFMSFRTDDIFVPETPEGDLIEISWCQKGRVECRFADQTYTHVSEGDFWVDAGALLPVAYGFPTGEFEAVTIVIERKALSRESIAGFLKFGIDIRTSCDVLGLDLSWYINRIDSRLHHIFKEICTSVKRESIGYFRIKTLEIMHYVNQLTRDTGREITYYSKDQIEAVKRIWTYLISHPDEKCVLEELAKREKISMTVLRNIFHQMYGASPYAYLKKYKMDVAARLLTQKQMRISDIAVSLGYSNPSKFTAAFRDIYGVLPKDYRKK